MASPPPPAPFLATIKSWELDVKPPFLGRYLTTHPPKPHPHPTHHPPHPTPPTHPSPVARKLGLSGGSNTHVLPEDVRQWAGEDFNINREDLLISEHRLGAGSFGAVYEGYYRDQLVAIKFQRLPHDGPILENLRTELSLLKNLSHPNLVLFYGAAPIDGDEAGVLMVMEFCRGGSLETVIDRVRVGDVSMEISWAVSRGSTTASSVEPPPSPASPPPCRLSALPRRRTTNRHEPPRTNKPAVRLFTADQLRFRWVKEMAYALRAMHAQSIIHRDVKSANVLLDDQWSTKLCDYGLAVSSTSPSRMLFSGYATTRPQRHSFVRSLVCSPASYPLPSAEGPTRTWHPRRFWARRCVGDGGSNVRTGLCAHRQLRWPPRIRARLTNPRRSSPVWLRGGHLRPRNDHGRAHRVAKGQTRPRQWRKPRREREPRRGRW